MWQSPHWERAPRPATSLSAMGWITASARSRGGCAITLHSVGPRTLTASYAGDGNFTGSMSTDETHLVLAITAQGDAGGGPVTATITSGTCIGFCQRFDEFYRRAHPAAIGVTFPTACSASPPFAPATEPAPSLSPSPIPHPLPTGTQY